MKRYYRLWSLLALVIFISYQGCVIHFTHFHQFAGESIVHFHPYSKKLPSHHHTLKELMKIDALLHNFLTIVSIFILAAVATSMCLLLPINVSRIPLRQIVHTHLYRGPPSF